MNKLFMLFLVGYMFNSIGQVNCGPELDLGTDTVCYLSPFILASNEGYDSYLWQNGSIDSTFLVTEAGVYVLQIEQLMDNVIVNGDFENGDIGFSSDYLNVTNGGGTALINEQTYAISNVSNNNHPFYSACMDHTSGNGNMMVVNGSSSANDNIWCQTISVMPNTVYQFSTWLTSVDPTNPAVLQFSVDGVSLGTSFTSTGILCQWEQFFETWNSGNNTSITICIKNQNTILNGNDFALDDIYFAPICVQYDTVIVVATPSADFSVNTDCSGFSNLIDNSIIYSPIAFWEWSLGDNTLSNLQNPIHNYNDGSYLIELKIEDNYGCRDSITRNYNFQSNPILNLGPDTVCFTQGLFLDATSNYDFYNWNTGDTTSLITVTDTGYYVVSVSQINENLVTNSDFDMGDSGFSSSYTSNSLFEGGYDVLQASGGLGNGNCSIDHTSGTGNMMVINGGTIPNTPIWCQTINVTPNTNYIFYTWLMNLHSVNPPELQFQINGVNLGSTFMTSNNTCQWNQFFETWNSGNANTATICILNQSLQSNGNDLAIDDIFFGELCEQTDSVYVAPNPVANFVSNDVCFGDSTYFVNNSIINSDGIGSLSWNFGDFNYSNEMNPVHYYNNEGTYSVNLIIQNSFGCVDSISNSVSIYPSPQAEFSYSNSCENDSSSVVNQTVTNVGYSLNWSISDGSIINNDSIIYNPFVAGSYSIQLNIENIYGCADSIMHIVDVYPTPSAQFVFNDTCLGSEINFYDNSIIIGGLIQNWNWTFGNGSFSNLINPEHTYLTEGDFIATLEVTSTNGCVDSVSNQIAIFPNPVSNFEFENVCEENGANFINNSQISNTGTIVNSIWNFGDGSPVLDQESVEHQYFNSGTYNISLTSVSSDGCDSHITDSIVVFPKPDANFSSSIECENSQSTQFIDESTIDEGNISGWSWIFDQTIFSSSQNSTKLFDVNNNIVVQLIIESDNGCVDSVENQVVFNESPSIDFIASNLENCSPFCTEFNVISNNENSYISNWQWDFGNGEVSTDSVPQICFINPSNSIDFYFDVELSVVNNLGCSATVLKHDYIGAMHNPLAQFTVNTDNTQNQVNVVNLENMSIGADYYSMNFGNDEWLFGFEDTYAFDSSGNYPISLVATTDFGCTDTAVNFVNIESNINYYVPNAFTPDQDGYNNDFRPIFNGEIEPLSYHLIIFNRWGELVFESFNTEVGWGGTYGSVGEVCEDGVYVWKIDFVEKSNKQHELYGFVTLLK